ncbi:acyl-CoA dehydrogenase family protein [Tranquillimonas alkanivorans]|uniref:Acyl-CoA dehydrogenase n=1 Tax=Tranquillimonas alkanivorans TaxID=441119 RepID=A0A1I5Q0U8_9RHOB|nr:acyl-CoA dehydrogenase family protein [Tranquillimonas alkanivorans]SFP39968.1 hypothetical protein SAMN04488047_10621 [Tranquillimonas alkanivorans]
MSAQDQLDRTLAMLAATPGWHRLQELRQDLDDELATAVLDGARRLSDEVLAPLDDAVDREGCRVENGRVKVPAGYHAAWRAFAEGGWIGLDTDSRFGGAGLPLVVQAAATQLFDRACPAFNMGAGATRSAAVLLAERASPELAQDWVPALVAGERAATICISEPGAGSDVGRIRTRAVRDGDRWKISGQKIWISFGDHDLTPRICHCLLARSSDAPGTRGLSLFLVPNAAEDGRANGVSVQRIEKKMGLHGSPTCVLEFEDAEGELIGDEGRGLSQLFTMIELMRLQVGCQGLGIASRACAVAESYASERLQGGDPSETPVPIATHPDVRRQLAAMRGRTELLRAAVLELAVTLDLARAGEEDAAARAAWILPLVKTFGAETGFGVADAGIQVLGGAGYTKEWPLERALRDARVMAIYEGTTGMQGIDFLERRLVRDRAGFNAFLTAARAAQPQGDPRSRTAEEVIDRLERLAERLRACPDAQARLGAADAWLRAGWIGVAAWLWPRLGDDAAPVLLALPERLAVLEAEIAGGLETAETEADERLATSA